jgi:MarR family transcriptional regulator, organic hydroperoxide resistance regulator
MSKLPFGFEQPEDSPGFLLWQTTISWQRLIKKALDPHDISHAQFVIMALLLWLEGNKHDTTQTTIIKWSKLDKMTVSKSLKKLSSMGLVVRAEHEADTRAKTVVLTEKGNDLVRKLVPLVEAVDEKFFRPISGPDQQKLMSLFKTIMEETS